MMDGWMDGATFQNTRQSMNFQARISNHQFPVMNFILLYGRCLSLHIHLAAMTLPIIGIIGVIGSA
jgi:hypothetical protein